MRDDIRRLVENIVPLDAFEEAQRKNALAWIDSGAELCRRERPAAPPKHLVCYFVLIDQARERVLLVDHLNARRWLPPGGHVEPNEHPRRTVIRECWEELHVHADFLVPDPLFVTETLTGGRDAGHVDVSLWYALRGSDQDTVLYDPREFAGVNWFAFDLALALPTALVDPHFSRFLLKWRTLAATMP